MNTDKPRIVIASGPQARAAIRRLAARRRDCFGRLAPPRSMARGRLSQ
jgi:hypothetical protein